MKKYLLIICLIILIPKVRADTWFGSWEKLTEMNVTFIKDDKVYSNSPFLFRMEDGKIVYCVKPFTDIGHDSPYIEYLYNDSKFELTDEHLEKIKLIAYYGYNYPGHEDRKWYGITQFLIWKTFDLDDIYFTNERYGERINAYQYEINEIEFLVENHNALPSFYNSSLNYRENNNYIEYDNNNILDNYVISNSNIDSYINENSLYINTKEDGEYFIEFKRKKDLNNNYILYGLDGYQSLFYPGGIEDLTFRINISVNTGTITINKKDSENKERLFAKLDGAKYEITSNGNTIDTLTTNEYGIASIDNLDLGAYLIKEVEAPEGYLIDKNIYYINLTKENKDGIVYSYEDIIKGNIIINKYYGENDNYSKEYDSVFELYDVSNNLIKEYKLESGTIEDKLEYGEYYLKQVKGIDGYKFIDELKINIDEDRLYTYNLYNEKIPIENLVVDVPNTGVKTNYSVPFILVLTGLVLVFLSKIKTTVE